MKYSCKNPLAKTIASVDLIHMKSLPQSTIIADLVPSIQDLGRYSEGFCFRLNFADKGGIWTICTERQVYFNNKERT